MQAHYLQAPSAATAACAAVARTAIRLIGAFVEADRALSEQFEQHRAAKIIRTLPGLGAVLGPRCSASSVMTGSGSPAQVSQGRRRHFTRRQGIRPQPHSVGPHKRRLAGNLEQWAFCSLNVSLGDRRYYDKQRARRKLTGRHSANSPTAG